MMNGTKTFRVEFVVENNELRVDSVNDGFTAIEVLGLLEYKKADIIAQIQGPDNFSRKCVSKEGQMLGIEKKEVVE